MAVGTQSHRGQGWREGEGGRERALTNERLYPVLNELRQVTVG